MAGAASNAPFIIVKSTTDLSLAQTHKAIKSFHSKLIQTNSNLLLSAHKNIASLKEDSRIADDVAEKLSLLLAEVKKARDRNTFPLSAQSNSSSVINDNHHHHHQHSHSNNDHNNSTENDKKKKKKRKKKVDVDEAIENTETERKKSKKNSI